ncbi:MAG: DUF2313 domain-containing protein [Candidatus Accumulibacter sp.]|jgi:uncharacterized protein YmfQ (DUF2313 family)|nr:DUF2313 domain-containing protein [Accumulibacter sp.]
MAIALDTVRPFVAGVSRAGDGLWGTHTAILPAAVGSVSGAGVSTARIRLAPSAAANAVSDGAAGMTVAAPLDAPGEAAAESFAGMSVAAILDAPGVSDDEGTARLSIARPLIASGETALDGAAEVKPTLTPSAHGVASIDGEADVTVGRVYPAEVSALANAYRVSLQALLPQGLAWPRQPDAVLTRLLAAFAEEFARVDTRAKGLIAEAIPSTTTELLADWERVVGLPDECSTEVDTTLEERRRTLVAMLTRPVGATRDFWISQAVLQGYSITIDEFRPFVAGLSRCGHQLWGGAAVRHVWRVRVHGVRYTPFRAGVSRCGERLGKISFANGLECRMRKYKQAHTTLIFDYGDEL